MCFFLLSHRVLGFLVDTHVTPECHHSNACDKETRPVNAFPASRVIGSLVYCRVDIVACYANNRAQSQLLLPRRLPLSCS
jgi:hypothetical protein